MYHVINWDDSEVIKSFENVNSAKRFCRQLGHTGKTNPFLTGYSPIAFVSDSKGCVYNPRFAKPEEEKSDENMA